MSQKAIPTLLELAIKSLLSNEPAAIQTLDELLRYIFVLLFTWVFLGTQKEMLKSMVQVWPFYCLHIGVLNKQEPLYEILEAMVDGLHLLRAQNSSSWGSKLRILDLRQDCDCEIVCMYRGLCITFGQYIFSFLKAEHSASSKITTILLIRFMKMDQESIPTLTDFAAKKLLSNEPIAIQALEVLPKHLYIPLFKSAFLGRHKKVLNAMVRVWPFYCLHIGALCKQEPPYEILEAIMDGMQFLPVQDTSSGGPQLRILDLRQSQDYEITCYYRFQQNLCSHSCVYSHHSIIKIEEVQHRVMFSETVSSESASSWKPMELLVNLSFNSNLRRKRFLLFIKRKIEQSFGSLHLCCRYLQINHISMHTSSLQILDPVCVNHLEVNLLDLKKVITLFPHLIHLNSLTLSSIPFQSCNGPNFETFLTWLGKLDTLQELSFSFSCLTDQLHKVLRVLQHPVHLHTLKFPFCQLSNRDLTLLSQSNQVTHLERLDLSNNQIFCFGYESFQILLERVSGTLQHLEINNCKITDSELSAVLPALSHCSHLHVLSLAYNSLTMMALVNLLQSLAPLSNLRHVVYPVPVHCYELGSFRVHLDLNKLAAVKAQLNLMLYLAQRNDMYWTTSQGL